MGLEFVQLILVLLLMKSSLSDSYQCSSNPLPARKLFYHAGVQQDVKILSSSRVESRWAVSHDFIQISINLQVDCLRIQHLCI